APLEAVDAVVAYRGAHRWVQGFEPLRLEAEDGAPPLEESGVYLITGGLGGLGLEVARHLARDYKARLVLVGRSGLPPREGWKEWIGVHGPDDRTSRRIAIVRELEEAGAEVLVVAADVADRDRMRSVQAEALARFGAIDGLFHAAGLPGIGLIETKSREAAAAVLAPKVQGTLVLADVFADPRPRFLALFSSVTAVLSQLGQADYSAANAF